jgi:glycosyltransferase involved in cell wall biosynthesis
MIQPLISVVLPVYNVEVYLKKCLETVVNQTYKNLDIILVDDGSTDNSGEICDEYAKKDRRIHCFHKKNGGLSDARNYGISQAQGDYITFIDSDDTVDHDMIEYLYYLINKFNCRLSLCTHNIVTQNGHKITHLGDGTEESLTAEKALESMLYHGKVDTSAWAKLYDIHIFDEINYPVGKLFEDIGTTYKTFIAAGKVACGYNPKYNYFVRNNSIVTSSFSEKKLDLLEMTDEMAKDVVSYYPSLTAAVLRRRVYARFSTLNQMYNLTLKNKQKQDIINFIKNEGKKILSDNKAPIRDKLAYIIICCNVKIYEKVSCKMNLNS